MVLTPIDFQVKDVFASTSSEHTLIEGSGDGNNNPTDQIEIINQMKVKIQCV